MLMVRLGSFPAIGAIEIMMLGRVRMACETHRIATPLEQSEESVAILQVLIGFVVEKRVDRNVHRHDDQRVVRRVREYVAHKLELALVEPAFVLPPSPNFMRVESEIVDVVEHQEKRLPVEERVIVRAEHTLESLAAVFAVWRFKIEIVVAPN